MSALPRGPHPLPEPKPLLEHEREIVESIVTRFLPDAVHMTYADVLWHEQREAHVIAVLREATAWGGGYGFAVELLRYLEQDVPE